MIKIMIFVSLVFASYTAKAEKNDNVYDGLNDAQIESIQNLLDQFEFDHPVISEWHGPRRPRGPRRPIPRGPRYPRRPEPPRGPIGHWRCYAENYRQQIFVGEDRDRYYAMGEALARCERVSRRCFAMDCELVRRWPY